MQRLSKLFATFLGVLLLSNAAAEDSDRRHRDDSQAEASIRELVRRGAVVKRFSVRESGTQGLLVRLKAEHLDARGTIEWRLLGQLQTISDLSLELRGLRFSDEGLKSLMSNVSPIGLDLSGTAVSDLGLADLIGPKTRIRLLDLSFTQISDDGLRSVAALRELRYLSLIGSRITDCGMTRLDRLQQLQEIYLAETAVSLQAAARLHCKLPLCRIER